MGKGAAKERELRDWFRDKPGCDAIRMGGSGSGGDQDLPDIFATDGADRYAIELKYTGGDSTQYVQPDEWAALDRFALRWDAHPLLVWRFAYDTTWYFVTVHSQVFSEELTDGDTIAGKKTQLDRYEQLSDIIEAT